MLQRETIENLFGRLDVKLRESGVIGELYLVGGAVMSLVYRSRPSTKDIDAYFEPKELIRSLARSIAEEEGLDDNWLNDAVKGFLSKQRDFDPYREFPNLRVFVAAPAYLLAMKCLAMRLGPEFHDEIDIRFLLRYLNIEEYDQALTVITRYYPLEKFPQKTLYALEEILSG
jgi:hypothetical protein